MWKYGYETRGRTGCGDCSNGAEGFETERRVRFVASSMDDDFDDR